MVWKMMERTMGLLEWRVEATLVSFTSQDAADTDVTKALKMPSTEGVGSICILVV